MPICPICDDSGLTNSDSKNPKFCYCAAGKQAKRQWEAGDAGRMSDASSQRGSQLPKPSSFIDVAQIDQVNASVDAMRASLLGTAPTESGPAPKNSTVQLLYRIARPGHEISMVEAAQIQDLAKSLEGFLGDLAFIGRKKG
jgi:hypothetical protein